MAESFARAYGLNALSAGTMPAENVNPVVIQAMKERGIPVLGKPKMLTEQMITEANLVVTMGCSAQDVCPALLARKMQKKLVDWQIEYAKGKRIDEVRKIASEIERNVTELLKR
jgi:protein-tyrosine-phosphatase